MGSWHYCSLAFLFKADRVGESLAEILGPDTPFVEIVSAQSIGLNQEFNKPLLRVNVAQLKPAEQVRAEIGAMPVDPFPSLLSVYADARAPRGFRVPDLEHDPAERLPVQSLAWLARQIGAPVGYWEHTGNHGLIDEIFLGFGPAPAAMINFEEVQASGWDPARPRGALTAALWHIGANVPNRDECSSFYATQGDLIFVLPRDGRPERIMRRVEWPIYERTELGRQVLPELPAWLRGPAHL